MKNSAIRRLSRIVAVESFFSYLARDKKISLKNCFNHILEEVGTEENMDVLEMIKIKKDGFCWDLISEADKNFAKMKIVLRVFAPEFPYEKIAPINRIILILGLSEMKFIKTPPIVVINEYVEIAKIFGEEKSASFINAVLDNFRKEVGLEK